MTVPEHEMFHDFLDRNWLTHAFDPKALIDRN
jgi:hypothetical protein